MSILFLTLLKDPFSASWAEKRPPKTALQLSDPQNLNPALLKGAEGDSGVTVCHVCHSLSLLLLASFAW